MSSPLAVAAVSAVLRNLLDNGLVDVGNAVGAVAVTAVAPDLIKLDDPNAGPSLNLFLHRVTPNQGWRNVGMPAYDGGGGRLANPPLALDLGFLVTAYGVSDFQAEILLGYAMSVLHEHPVLDRAAVRRALDPSPLGPSILPPAFQALAASDLADQVESVRVTWEPMDGEEMSRLWSAMQAHYRPTAAYVASVVLIEAERPVRHGLPVLSRGPVDPATGRDRGVVVAPSLEPPLPTLVAVRPPGSQVAARLGDVVRLEGVHLDGTGLVVDFAHPLLDTPRTLTVGTHDEPRHLDVTLPSGATAFQEWPAGVWSVSVRLTRTGERVERTTAVAAMLLAPVPVLAPAPAVVRGAGAVTVTLGVRPRVRPSQRATLALGTDVAVADPHPTAAASLTFRFGEVPDGARRVRLTVDGVESLLVDTSTTPPSFDPAQTVTVPA